MPFVPLRIPPGVIRPATALQAKGRYWDANLIRWRGNKLLPVGGWQRATDTPLDSQARTIFPWLAEEGDALADPVTCLQELHSYNSLFAIAFKALFLNRW